MPYRDQKHRTYAAEWATWTSSKSNRPVDLVYARKLVASHLPGWKLRRAHKGSHGWCYQSARRIDIGSTSPLWIVLHEIAHGKVAQAGLPPGHHEVFRYYYVSIVRQTLGPYWGNKLLRQFSSHRLDVCSPTDVRPSLAKRIAGLFRRKATS